MISSILQNNKWLIGIAVIELLMLVFLVYVAVTIHQKQQQLSATQDEMQSKISTFSKTKKQLIKDQERLTKTQGKLQSDVGALADTLSTSRDQLQSLKTKTQDKLQQVRETASKKASEEASEEIQEVRTSLESEISEQINDSNQKISSIVSDWAPRIALVRCGDESEGTQHLNLGSATLFSIEGKTVFLTNRHVLMEGSEKEERCLIDFPESSEDSLEITRANIRVSGEEFDFGYLVVEEPTSYMEKQLETELSWCQTQPEVGASMVVIGYPKIGADNSITATEGIISGYDGRFYVSSAKVDKGNSGGVAVWSEKNCYLGIPTKTYKGVAEALARILDAREIELSGRQ